MWSPPSRTQHIWENCETWLNSLLFSVHYIRLTACFAGSDSFVHYREDTKRIPSQKEEQKSMCRGMAWAGERAGLLLRTAFPLPPCTCSSLVLMNPENKPFCTSESYWSLLAVTSLWIKLREKHFCKSFNFFSWDTLCLGIDSLAPMGCGMVPVNFFLISKTSFHLSWETWGFPKSFSSQLTHNLSVFYFPICKRYIIILWKMGHK